MNARQWIATVLAGVSAVSLTGCADLDNPAALSDLDLVANVEVPDHMHTLTDNDFHIQVFSGSDPVHMRRLELDVVSPGAASARPVPIEEVDGEFRARVYLYAAGEHHFRLRGQLDGHHLMQQIWEHEAHSARTHIVADDHRFELETSPAPILPGGLALLHAYAYELEPDGSKGPEAHDLQLAGSLHHPDGTEVAIAWAEQGHGEYEGRAVFPTAGSYSLQISPAGEGGHDGEAEGNGGGGHSEFHIRVPSASGDSPPPEEEGDGHGH